MKPHILSEAEERLLALGDIALDGYDDTFSQLTNVDMKFGALLDEQGREHPLTQSSFSSFLVKRDHALRKRAFHQFYESSKTTNIPSRRRSLIRSKLMFSRARAQFPSALEASLFRDDVPTSVYDGLIAAVRAHLAPLFRYYDLRRAFSVWTNFIITTLMFRSFPKSKRAFHLMKQSRTVLTALQPLGADYVDSLGEGLRGRWCDRYENKNKRSGAFSSGSYGAPPYILMNYKDDVFADVYTLAHEAGHSMHTSSRRNRSFFRITITRSFSRRSPRPSTKSCSRIICSSKPKIRRCAPISSTARSTTFAARSSGKPCSPSSRKRFTQSKKAVRA